MILSISTRRDIAEVMNWVKRSLGRVIPSEMAPILGQQLDTIMTIRDAHVELDKGQVQIYLGSAYPRSDDKTAAALQVATKILSTRLYLNLREEKGLAYSVGAANRTDQEIGWYYSALSTSAENYQTALSGIMLEIEKLKLDGPTPDEISRARNEIWGRLMMAKLSRINQAYYLGLNDYLGRDMAYDSQFLKTLSEVDIAAVQRAAARFFNTSGYIQATAGKRR